MKTFNQFSINEGRRSDNEILISGVKCRISVSAMQGNIDVNFWPSEEVSADTFGMNFKEEDYQKVYKELENKGFHPEISMRMHDGTRHHISIRVSKDKVNEVFSIYFDSLINDDLNL